MWISLRKSRLRFESQTKHLFQKPAEQAMKESSRHKQNVSIRMIGLVRSTDVVLPSSSSGLLRAEFFSSQSEQGRVRIGNFWKREERRSYHTESIHKLGALRLSPGPSSNLNRPSSIFIQGEHYEITMDYASQRGALGVCQAGTSMPYLT